MRLPDGVLHQARAEKLIAMDGPAIIRIDTHIPGNSRYREPLICPLEEDFAQALRGDWQDFDLLFQLERERGKRVVYSRVTYNGGSDPSLPRRPNITVVANLATTEHRSLESPPTVLGCTLARSYQVIAPVPRVEAVYEFLSNGLMLIDRNEGSVELWIAQAGDKVAVPSGCHMTLYNLGGSDHPLITLDLHRADCPPSSQDLARTCGPFLLIYYDDSQVTFVVNRLYVDSSAHDAGLRTGGALRDASSRQVRLARGARLQLDRFLYEQLTRNPEVVGRLARMGVAVKVASPEVDLWPLPAGRGPRLSFMMSLAEVTEGLTAVYRYFATDLEGGAE